MAIAANPQGHRKNLERHSRATDKGFEVFRREKLGVEPLPVPPGSIPRDPVELERMARRYRIDNAVACMMALADDEYEEAQDRIAAEKEKVVK